MTTGCRGVCRARVSLVCLLLLLGDAGSAVQDPQRPPFRTRTNIVRVDAYPTKDGKIIEGLTREDFEILEDGVPQRIESFEFVTFPQSNPVDKRQDPNSQRDSFLLAADPSYRVFAIYLDNLHVDFAGSHQARLPLINFLNRVLGPKDLFGLLTARSRAQDLVLGQKTDFIEEQLTKHWDWGRGARVLDDEEDLIIQQCFSGENPAVAAELVMRRRVDEVFSDLESLMALLSSIREERKNILLVSNGWPLPGRAPWTQTAVTRRVPGIGITDAGKLTTGATRKGEINPRTCETMLQRLGEMDFRDRMRDLLKLARESNVTFYSIKPSGLSAFRDTAQVDSLLTLSNNTDGIAVVNTNDLTTGARRIADDLAAAYLLAYAPTNTNPDGRVRRITVRLKKSGETVRSRREYRAPTADELATAAAAAAPAPPPTAAEEAFADLKRLRPGAVLHTRGSVIGDELVLVTELAPAEIEAGRWRTGGDLQVVVTAGSDVVSATRARIEAGQRAAVVRVPLSSAAGPFGAAIRLRSDADGEGQDGITVQRQAGAVGDPLVFRGAPGQLRPAGSVQFRRTERIEVRWPVRATFEQLEARVVGRDGVPLALQVTARPHQEGGVHYVAAALNLAPLTAGEYVLEVTGSSGGGPASGRLAFRVSR